MPLCKNLWVHDSCFIFKGGRWDRDSQFCPFCFASAFSIIIIQYYYCKILHHIAMVVPATLRIFTSCILFSASHRPPTPFTPGFPRLLVTCPSPVLKVTRGSLQFLWYCCHGRGSAGYHGHHILLYPFSPKLKVEILLANLVVLIKTVSPSWGGGNPGVKWAGSLR